jgi:hypothetical protein
MKFTWACGSDEGYRDKGRPYLKSLVANGITPVYVTVDFDDPDPLAGVNYIRLDSREFVSGGPMKGSLQRGEFLRCVDDGPVLFTDMDMVAQVPLYPELIQQLEGLQDGDVFVGFNAGEGDSLLQESFRLQPAHGDALGALSNIKFARGPLYSPAYNTGVLGMTKKTWGKVLKQFARLYPLVDARWQHHAKEQWLLSYLFTEMDLNVIPMPRLLHSHACFYGYKLLPIPPEYNVKDGVLLHSGRPVVLKHNWPLRGEKA